MRVEHSRWEGLGSHSVTCQLCDLRQDISPHWERFLICTMKGTTPALLVFWRDWRSNETVFGNCESAMQMTGIIIFTGRALILSAWFPQFSVKFTYCGFYPSFLQQNPLENIIFRPGIDIRAVALFIWVFWDKEKTGIMRKNRPRKMLAPGQNAFPSWCSFFPRWHWHLTAKPEILIKS